jgi:cystathionine beta-lyase/cystathionine gamma-synthase
MEADGPAKPPSSPPPTGLATRAVHVAREGSPLGPHGERPATAALYQTANFVYPDAEGAARAAVGEAYIYSRHGNPTVDGFARAVAELEGAEAGLAFASGMAAVATAILALAGDGPGDPAGEVLASEGIYGGTTELLTGLAPRFGVKARFGPAWDLAAFEAAIGPRTKVVLVETLSNPLLRVPDLRALGALARARGLAFVVDSTFTTPCLVRPLALGADVVVHSISKYISGHGDVIGGVAVGRSQALAPLYAMRTSLGGNMDPFAAWLALRGLRTLPLRLARQCESAAVLAAVLEGLPGVRRVHHPSRPHHPDHAVARAQLAAAGAMITLQLADGAAARRFYDRVRVFTRAASLGEVASLVTHPASFSHGGLPPEERARLGIDEGLVRLSIGIEDVADLEADLRQALA